MQRRSVVIIGGGVAGIAAAVALAEAGFQIELFEKRPLLGGRASSFLDPQTGERIDDCQHGTMRCCTNLADLLDRLGVHDQIRYFDALHFLDAQGRRSVIKGCGLPAPLHTFLSFLMFRSLGLRDKIAIGRGLLNILTAAHDLQHAKQRDAQTMAAWFQSTGQTERAVQRFWRPILVSACNEEPERIACTYGFKLFRDGFLIHPTAFHFGVPCVPLGTLYTEPTRTYLARRGSCVYTRTIVDKIHIAGGANGRVTGITLQNGEHHTADYYVSALQFDLLLKRLPQEVTQGVPYWENLQQIELVPILGVHLWFDRPLGCPPAIALLDRETEWIFNKTALFKGDVDPAASDRAGLEGTYLSLVISASRRYMQMPKEELLARVLSDVRACVPDARRAEVVRSHVIRWPKATLSPQPGVEALRPDQRSPLANFYVAGEWTQTGWPSTMEGAVRSGYRVAEYLLAREGREAHLVVPDLPSSGLARWLEGSSRPRPFENDFSLSQKSAS